MTTDDKRRAACRDIVTALHAWRECEDPDESEAAMFAMRRAAMRLEELCSDDAPPPRDLAAMCKSILLDPYKGGK